jgi:hypothetical protein
MAGRGGRERPWQHGLETEGFALIRSRQTLYGDAVLKRRQWSAERRAGLIAKARGTSRKGAPKVRRLGAPLPHSCEGKEKREALAPRLL